MSTATTVVSGGGVQQEAAQPKVILKITVKSVHAHKKAYPYSLQLSVGVKGRLKATGPKYLPLALLLGDGGGGTTPGSSLPARWDASTCTMMVPASKSIEWTIPSGDNGEYLEQPMLREKGQQIDFQLHKVKTIALNKKAAADAAHKRSSATVYSDKVVLATSDSEVTASL
jgi:hypothetical protein